MLCCAVLLAAVQSPLTLVQKAKCLVGAYPFWPDYGLLECLATSSSHQQL
jgi:hypothetical protein